MDQSDGNVASPNGARSGRSLLLRSYAWQEEPKATKGRSPGLGVRWHRGGRPARVRKGARGRTRSKTRVKKRVRNRRSKGRKKSSALLVDGRRPGLGKTSHVHAGEVEAALAVLVESAPRAPRKMRAPASARVATGASEARSHGVVARENLRRKTWGQGKS